jgi:hypothetical protein
MSESKTPLELLIKALEESKQSVASKEAILGLEHAINLVKVYEPVIEQKLELARQKGINEGLREAVSKFERE